MKIWNWRQILGNIFHSIYLIMGIIMCLELWLLERNKRLQLHLIIFNLWSPSEHLLANDKNKGNSPYYFLEILKYPLQIRSEISYILCLFPANSNILNIFRFYEETKQVLNGSSVSLEKIIDFIFYLIKHTYTYV